MKKIMLAAAAACGAYLYLVKGRSGHPGLKQLQSHSYAHRGLHGNGVPENSMPAFRAALEKGYGIELDIHLMADGELAVIHDSSLKRTAGVDVNITELTKEDLDHYCLEGTQEKIPLFSQVLELYAGKAPLIIELNADGNNHKALVDAACRSLEGYTGAYCMESFDPRCLLELKKNYPHVIRGQLTENFMRSQIKLNPALKFAMTHNLLNFATKPDFVAYDFGSRKATPSNFICRRVWDMQGVTWTLRDPADHKQAVKEDWLPIFENYEP